MKRILTFLFALISVTVFSQGITVTVGDVASKADTLIGTISGSQVIGGVSADNSDSLGGKSPYHYVDTATVQNIRGVKDFINVINANSGLQFVPTSGISHSEGLIFYDSITNTFSGFIDRANVTLNIGEENWLRIVNKSGGALSNGQAVYISGAQGNRPTILIAKADALSTSQGTIAVLTEDIADNDEGIATTFGLVRNFNTTGFTAGDELFLSATNAGGIVNVKPTAPDFVIRIGWAINSTVNGAILVNISVYGDGTNNTFIDQDVTITGSPTFDNLTADSINVDTLFANQLILDDYIRHHDINVSSATSGPTAPTATTVGTFRGLGYDADNEVSFFVIEVPSDWNGISDMTLVVHWYSASGDIIANGETVKWDIIYRSIAPGEAVDNGTAVVITATFTGGASEIDKEHYETSLTIDFDNANQPLAVGDDIGFQFNRDVSGDTYSGAGIVYKWDLIYTSNTIPRGD